MCVRDESHGRRPRKCVTDDNCRVVRQFIEHDCRLSVEEILSEVVINYGSVQSIITDILRLQKN